MSWTLIESDDALEPMLREIDSASAIMVDTEFMRTNTFFPRAALLQICCAVDHADAGEEPHAWLIDPLQISETDALGAFLADRSLVKVLHSASEDLEVFQRWLGVLPEPLFDTQRAAALLGIGFGIGYRGLVEKVTGVDLPKGETRSDWLQRPLTPAQCEYAAQDVTYLKAIWHFMRREASGTERFAWILADGEDTIASARAPNQHPYLRIKGAGRLSSTGLGRLEAICNWREEVAHRRNKPRGWIIDDKTCIALADTDPADRAAMKRTPGLPPAVLNRYADELLALLEQQRDVPASELPRTLGPPLSPAQRSQMKKLKGKLREIAEALGSTPEALLQSRDCEMLLREAAGEAIDEPRHWKGWRQELVVNPLREWLKSAEAG